MSEQACTLKRNGVVCGRPEHDKTVHVSEDERMRRGAHIWRHEPPKRRGAWPETR